MNRDGQGQLFADAVARRVLELVEPGADDGLPSSLVVALDGRPRPAKVVTGCGEGPAASRDGDLDPIEEVVERADDAREGVGPGEPLLASWV